MRDDRLTPYLHQGPDWGDLKHHDKPEEPVLTEVKKVRTDGHIENTQIGKYSQINLQTHPQEVFLQRHWISLYEGVLIDMEEYNFVTCLRFVQKYILPDKNASSAK